MAIRRRILQNVTVLIGPTLRLFLIVIIAISIDHSSGHVIRRNVVGFPSTQDALEPSTPMFTLYSENSQNTEDHQRHVMDDVQVQAVVSADGTSAVTEAASDDNELTAVGITIGQRKNKDMMKGSTSQENPTMKYSYTKESIPNMNSLKQFTPKENDLCDYNKGAKTLCDKICSYPKILVDKLLHSDRKPAYIWTDVLETDVQNKPVHTLEYKEPIVKEIVLAAHKLNNGQPLVP